MSTEPVIAEERVTLAEAVSSTDGKFAYRYDFGDGWEHERGGVEGPLIRWRSTWMR